MWDTCDWKNMNFNKAGHAACELCISRKNVWLDPPLGLLQWLQRRCADLREVRIWLASRIILQCDCAAVMQSYSARWVQRQNKCPWLFLEKHVIRGVHMILSPSYISFLLLLTYLSSLVFGDFKKNNSIFFSTGVAGWCFFPFLLLHGVGGYTSKALCCIWCNTALVFLERWVRLHLFSVFRCLYTACVLLHSLK